MHIHQQNHWNDLLFYWYQSYHWYQWTMGLTNPIRLQRLDMCANQKNVTFILGLNKKLVQLCNLYYPDNHRLCQGHLQPAV